MRFEQEVDIDLDIDDIIAEMSNDEKVDMYNELAKELDHAEYDESFNAAGYLSHLSPFEIKKVLCNALGVPSYYEDELLRNALEQIIKAN